MIVIALLSIVFLGLVAVGIWYFVYQKPKDSIKANVAPDQKFRIQGGVLEYFTPAPAEVPKTTASN